jgi:hypothetical protein
MRFCGHVPNSPRNKNLKRLILNLLKKVVFLDPKRLLSPFCRGKKTFSSTLNVMISQMVRNESVRFGRHIDIEVSYKILWLEVPKLIPILHYLACFRKAVLRKTPLVLQGLTLLHCNTNITPRRLYSRLKKKNSGSKGNSA